MVLGTEGGRHGAEAGMMRYRGPTSGSPFAIRLLKKVARLPIPERQDGQHADITGRPRVGNSGQTPVGLMDAGVGGRRGLNHLLQPVGEGLLLLVEDEGAIILGLLVAGYQIQAGDHRIGPGQTFGDRADARRLVAQITGQFLKGRPRLFPAEILVHIAEIAVDKDTHHGQRHKGRDKQKQEEARAQGAFHRHLEYGGNMVDVVLGNLPRFQNNLLGNRFPP